MTRYRHTQVGTLLIAAMLLPALIVLSLIASGQFPPIGVVFVAFMVVLTFLFHSLSVEVKDDKLIIRFGVGLIRKRIALETIESARRVRNRWYYGLGIKLTPHGWLWSVSGLDAVELSLSSGKRLRIGTNQPRELLQALASSGGIAISAGGDS